MYSIGLIIKKFLIPSAYGLLVFDLFRTCFLHNNIIVPIISAEPLLTLYRTVIDTLPNLYLVFPELFLNFFRTVAESILDFS